MKMLWKIAGGKLLAEIAYFCNSLIIKQLKSSFVLYDQYSIMFFRFFSGLH